MMLPITVIVPVHNHERFIGQCLCSIGNAKALPQEVILVDNASTDDSIGVAQKSGLPNLLIIRNSENLGAARARSIAVERARSDLIAFLDSDDYFGPDALQMAIDALVRDDLDASLFHVIRVTEDAATVLPFPDSPQTVIDGLQAFALTLGRWRIHACMLFKRQLYQRALDGFQYLGHADDEVLSRRILLLAKRIRGNQGVYYYRDVPKEPSSERIQGQIRANLRALAMGLDLARTLKDDRPLREMRNVIARDLVGLTVRAARGEVSWREVDRLARDYHELDVGWRTGDAKFLAMDVFVKCVTRFRQPRAQSLE